MGRIDKKSNIPYYLQIKDILESRIKNNIYPRETLIPSENELSIEFGVTRTTVRNSLKELQKEGLIYTEKGRGSIVKGSKIKQSLMEFYSFGRRFKQKEEGEAYSKIVEKKEIICPSEAKENLAVRDEDIIYEITRIRYVEKEPVMLEISYLPKILFPDLFDYDMENFSLYDMVEYRYKKNITKAREYIQPMISGTKESKLLNIEKKSPVFLVKRITYSGEKPLEYRKSIIRGDRYEFYTEFS